MQANSQHGANFSDCESDGDDDEENEEMSAYLTTADKVHISIFEGNNTAERNFLYTSFVGKI